MSKKPGRPSLFKRATEAGSNAAFTYNMGMLAFSKDGFKKVNELSGWLAGAAVLDEAATGYEMYRDLKNILEICTFCNRCYGDYATAKKQITRLEQRICDIRAKLPEFGSVRGYEEEEGGGEIQIDEEDEKKKEDEISIQVESNEKTIKKSQLYLELEKINDELAQKITQLEEDAEKRQELVGAYKKDLEFELQDAEEELQELQKKCKKLEKVGGCAALQKSVFKLLVDFAQGAGNLAVIGGGVVLNTTERRALGEALVAAGTGTRIGAASVIKFVSALINFLHMACCYIPNLFTNVTYDFKSLNLAAVQLATQFIDSMVDILQTVAESSAYVWHSQTAAIFGFGVSLVRNLGDGIKIANHALGDAVEIMLEKFCPGCTESCNCDDEDCFRGRDTYDAIED